MKRAIDILYKHHPFHSWQKGSDTEDNILSAMEEFAREEVIHEKKHWDEKRSEEKATDVSFAVADAEDETRKAIIEEINQFDGLRDQWVNKIYEQKFKTMYEAVKWIMANIHEPYTKAINP